MIQKDIQKKEKRLDIINKKNENINNQLFSYYFDYLRPSHMFERLKDAGDEGNKNQVKSIKKN